jgi:hypothetical protein
MRVIRAAIGTTTIDPELLTCAERLQYEGYLTMRSKQWTPRLIKVGCCE